MVTYRFLYHTFLVCVFNVRLSIRIRTGAVSSFHSLRILPLMLSGSQVVFTMEPQDNIPDCTKIHTLKTALPNISTSVQKLLHIINTYKTCERQKRLERRMFLLFLDNLTVVFFLTTRHCRINTIYVHFQEI
jgi:hypothetical protein